MGLFKKIKKAGGKGLNAVVPGKGASVKGAVNSKAGKAVKGIGRGAWTMSGLKGVRGVTKKLEDLNKKNRPGSRRGY